MIDVWGLQRLDARARNPGKQPRLAQPFPARITPAKVRRAEVTLDIEGCADASTRRLYGRPPTDQGGFLGERSTPTKSADEWLDDIQQAVSRGELIEAYDLAERALAEFPNHLKLRYTAVLVLGRSGATLRARSTYNRFKFADAIRGSLNSTLKQDIAALDARIAKDQALAAHGAARRKLLATAAARYEAIFRRTRAAYPAVSAATLWLLAGMHPKAKSLALEGIKICARAHRRGGLNAYFSYATEAEAALILGNVDSARAALVNAARYHGGDLSALATTRRQLKLVCAARGISIETLAPLSAPSVIHYAGHVIGPRFPASQEARVRTSITDSIARLKVGFAYGSLAGGADILFAEALVEAGAEVNVTIPFDAGEFRRISVAPSGRHWIARFDNCLRLAKTVTFATTERYLGDVALFGYADRIAMGLALLRARYLDTSVHQIAVWDGRPQDETNNFAGTASNVGFWLRRNLPIELISPQPSNQPLLDIGKAQLGKARRSVAPRAKPAGGRSIRAILFCDVKGFGQLREAQLPIFEREVLGRFARVLAHHRRDILFRNTWGDGLFVVASGVEAAAHCAIDLLEEMESFSPTRHGMAENLGLRIAGHVGPVYRLRDPVLKRWNYVGSHVSLTAMIEPVTPEGAAYVTEAFAAELATDANSRFDCEYVGQLPAAKNFGTMRMYSLKRGTVAVSVTRIGS